MIKKTIDASECFGVCAISPLLTISTTNHICECARMGVRMECQYQYPIVYNAKRRM